MVENRLNGLAQLNIHRKIKINKEEALDKLPKKIKIDLLLLSVISNL